MKADIELLAIQHQTGLVLTPSGRIEWTNSPDRSPGPRFSLAGCVDGNVAAVGSGEADAIADELMALANDELPFAVENGAPKHLDRYVALLSRNGPTPKAALGVSYVLPNRLAYEHGARLVHSHTQEGRDLIADLTVGGLPQALLELGFRDDVSEFWDPWCVALHDGQIASIAFAARLSAAGADLGLASVRSLRGRGYAAAATAGWAASPALGGHALFYSTDQTNTSSRRVIARLGLRFLGATLRLSSR